MKFNSVLVFLAGLVAILGLAVFSPIGAQERIVETVSVKAWVLPIFAVNTKGEPVLDLTKSDIELFANNQKIENFSFFKKTFFVKEKHKQQQQKPVIERKKIIFLLFDTALSRVEATMRSKSIAINIVKNSEKNSQFIVMQIESIKGLRYLGGPTKNKG